MEYGIANEEQKKCEGAKHLVIGLLDKHGVDTSAWGTGKAKTLEHLVGEVAKGECSLVTDETGELRRHIEVLAVDVLHRQDDGTYLHLVEAKQVFTDGRVRVRELPQSISEKLVAGETPGESLMRGLEEELGITQVLEAHDLGVSAKEAESESYPGLVTRTTVYDKVALIAEADFCPTGYQEVQSDKTTYFEWQIVS